MKALTRGFFIVSCMFLGCGDSNGTTKDTASPGTEVDSANDSSGGETTSDTTVVEESTAAVDSSEPDVEETADTTVADVEPDTDKDTIEATCDPYPLDVYGDPAAKATAEAALAALAPGATMTWDDDKGTLTSIQALNIPLPGCSDGTADFFEQAWAVIEAHPDIFQIDRSEWDQRDPVPCSAIGTSFETLNFGRHTLGGQRVLKDIFVFLAVRVDGVVNLRGVNGFYLPASTPELAARLASCPELDTAAALEAVGKTDLPFETFFHCTSSGNGVYRAHPDDALVFDEDAYWVWDDDPSGGVRLQKLHDAHLIVADPNITQDLLDSDANCPAEPPATGRVIGFRITFDPVTGALLFSLPGFGCIVC